MTFPARLTELLDAIKNEKDPIKRFAYVQQMDALLVNKAEALRDLVAAAEKLKLALDAKIVMEGRNGVHKKLDDHLAWRQNDELAQRMAEEALALYSEALAKLEEQ